MRVRPLCDAGRCRPTGCRGVRPGWRRPLHQPRGEREAHAPLPSPPPHPPGPNRGRCRAGALALAPPPPPLPGGLARLRLRLGLGLGRAAPVAPVPAPKPRKAPSHAHGTAQTPPRARLARHPPARAPCALRGDENRRASVAAHRPVSVCGSGRCRHSGARVRPRAMIASLKLRIYYKRESFHPLWPHRLHDIAHTVEPLASTYENHV